MKFFHYFWLQNYRAISNSMKNFWFFSRFLIRFFQKFEIALGFRTWLQHRDLRGIFVNLSSKRHFLAIYLLCTRRCANVITTYFLRHFFEIFKKIFDKFFSKIFEKLGLSLGYPRFSSLPFVWDFFGKFRPKFGPIWLGPAFPGTFPGIFLRKILGIFHRVYISSFFGAFSIFTIFGRFCLRQTGVIFEIFLRFLISLIAVWVSFLLILWDFCLFFHDFWANFSTGRWFRFRKSSARFLAKFFDFQNFWGFFRVSTDEKQRRAVLAGSKNLLGRNSFGWFFRLKRGSDRLYLSAFQAAGQNCCGPTSFWSLHSFWVCGGIGLLACRLATGLPWDFDGVFTIFGRRFFS